MMVNDYKYDIINIMDCIGAVSNMSLVLVLQGGVAIGRLPVSSDFDDETSIVHTFTETLENNRKSEKQNSPQSIYLLDVKYTSGNLTVDLPFMVFFIDQVVGVSFGHLKDN